MNYKHFKHLPHHSQASDNAKTETTESGRVYDIDGKKYPSVTTVTGFAKQAFFAEWRKNNPKEMTRVLDRGNKLHQCVEDYLNNKKPSPDDWGPFIWQLFMQMKSESFIYISHCIVLHQILHLMWNKCYEAIRGWRPRRPPGPIQLPWAQLTPSQQPLDVFSSSCQQHLDSLSTASPRSLASLAASRRPRADVRSL